MMFTYQYIGTYTHILTFATTMKNNAVEFFSRTDRLVIAQVLGITIYYCLST